LLYCTLVHEDEDAARQRRADPPLACPAGWVDGIVAEPGGWGLSGWMVMPSRGPFDAVRARWNGHDIELVSSVDRPDLDDSLYWIRGVRRSGFRVRIQERDADGRLELVVHPVSSFG
jgi:hypothetical protein